VDCPGLPHFAPKDQTLICLFQSGGPSHLDLFDDKTVLREHSTRILPDSIRQGQRITDGRAQGTARRAAE